MAENNNNKKDKPSGSLLRTAVIASPLAAGIGYAAYKGRQNSIVESAATGTNTVENAVSLLSELDNKARYERLSSRLDRVMSSKYTQTPEGIAALKEAWKVALLTSGKTSGKLGAKLSGLHALGDVEFLENLSSLGKQTSRHSWTMVEKFIQAAGDLSGIENLNFTVAKDFMLTPSEGHLTKRSQNFLKAQKILDQYLPQYNYTFNTIDKFAKEGYGYHTVQARIGNETLKFNLPSSVGGTIMEGMTLTNKAIAPDIGIVSDKGIEIISREEFFAKQISETVVPKIESGELKGRAISRKVNELYQATYSALESIPNISPQHQPPGQAQYETLRGSALDLVTTDRSKNAEAAYRALNLSETLSTLEKHSESMGLFAGTGAEAFSKGRVQRKNFAMSTLFPEAVDWSRKPEALNRPWNLSSSTRENLKKISPDMLSHPLEKDIASEFQQGFNVLTLYTDTKQLANQAGETYRQTGEGILYGSNSLQNTLEYEVGRNVHLKIFNAKNADEFLARAMSGQVKAGEILGTDDAGKIIKMNENARIAHARKTTTVASGDQITLEVIQNYRVGNNAKWFNDIKGLMQWMDKEKFHNEVAREIGDKNMAQNIQTIADINDLRKDPAKFGKQIMTGMHYLFEARKTPVDQLSSVQQQFLFNPSTFLSHFRDTAMASGSWNNQAFAKDTMKFAIQDLGFTPKEFGLAFGTVPAMFGSETASDLLAETVGLTKDSSRSEIAKWAYHDQAMKEGKALGFARINWGGPEELRGAGALGSLEPRAADIFAGPAFSGWNQDIAKEMLERLDISNPEKQLASSELWKTLQSMSGKLSPETGAATFNVGEFDLSTVNKAFSERLNQSGSFWINPGQGMNPIYVPDPDNLKRMQTISMVGEKEITGDMASHYHQMIDSISGMYSSVTPSSVESVRKDLFGIQSELQKQWAPMGKGAGSVFRGKVLGSRFGTGVDVSSNYRPKDLYTVGVTDELFENMFREMEQSNLYDTAELGDMSKRFRSGEKIGSILGRHPFIGAYSIQPMAMERIEGAGLQIAIPEERIAIQTAAGEALDVQLGPLVGMAGDKDADIYASFLLSPKLEKQALAAVTTPNSEFKRTYAEHQIRYQLLKAKQAKNAVAEELTPLAKMLTGAHKLSIVPEWVPKLSTKMTEAKRAVLAFGDNAQTANALALLEWAEQTPISGKHMSEIEIGSGAISRQLTQMLSALEENRGSDLKEIFDSLLKYNPTGQNLLTQDLNITDESAKQISSRLGVSFGSKIRGMDMNAAIETLTKAQTQYRAEGGSRMAEIFSGRGRSMTANEIGEMSVNKTPGFMKNMVSKIMGAENEAIKMGGSVIKNHKAIGFGIAGALAIGAVLAKPSNLVGSARGASPQANLNTPRGSGISGAESNATGYEHRVGKPTHPSPILPSAARISPSINQTANTKNFNFAQSADTKKFVNNLKRQGGGNAKISVNLRDSRNQFSENYYANKPD